MVESGNELVEILAFDQSGRAFPVGLSAKIQRRKTVPYAKWALVNLQGPLPELVRTLNQTQARILLALIFVGKPLRLKDLAALVGAPTSQACREVRRLVESGVVEQSDGAYQVSVSIRWIGKWEKPCS